MARKKPGRPAVKKARKKSAPVSAARKKAKNAKKTTRRVVKSVRKAAKKAGQRAIKSARKAAKPLKKLASRARAAVKKARRAPAARRAVTAVRKALIAVAGVAARVKSSAKKPNLDRPRKTIADIHGVPSSWGASSVASAARTGRAELHEKLRKNTSVSPALTAGDVDADWQSAESSGDESPGGDNPTPDQDVVDEIGRALGVEYHDDEELQGGDEIADRDRHRWELDPNSAEDFDDKD